MRKRTLITLIVAVLTGVAAFVLTHDLLRSSPPGHNVSSDDQDPGLIP